MNKEQLEQLSDFNLNKLISVKLGLNVSKDQWMHLGDRDENVVIIDTSGDSSDIRNHTFDTVDYCNNPSDMMPLVFERGIGLHPMGESDIEIGMSWLTSDWAACGIDYGEDNEASMEAEFFESKSDNPLRAAAIVYLLMKTT